MYGMEVTSPSPIEIEVFRRRTRLVYDKWAEKIGTEWLAASKRSFMTARTDFWWVAQPVMFWVK
jgi:hypothetical protein